MKHRSMVRRRACERRRGACSRSARLVTNPTRARSRRAPCDRNAPLKGLARAPRSVVAIQEWWHLSPAVRWCSMSKEARSDAAFYLVCSALAHGVVATTLPVHDVYELETREPTDPWFYASDCGLESTNEARLRAAEPGTRFVVSERFYEKDAECWVLRMAGSEWIDVFVKSDRVRRVR